MSTILAIDPSTSAAGWAVMGTNPVRVVASGVIRPSKAKAAPHAHDQLAAKLRTIWTEHRPEHVVVEWPDCRNYGRRRKASDLIVYGAAVGAACAAAGTYGTPVSRVTVERWKGTRAKLATIHAVQFIPGAGGVTDDNQADAIGLGDWWLRVGRYSEGRAEP